MSTIYEIMVAAGQLVSAEADYRSFESDVRADERNAAYDALRELITAALADAERKGAEAMPVGWRMVPVDPTPEMIDALPNCTVESECIDGWRAMIAAAPGHKA